MKIRMLLQKWYYLHCECPQKPGSSLHLPLTPTLRFHLGRQRRNPMIASNAKKKKCLIDGHIQLSGQMEKFAIIIIYNRVARILQLEDKIRSTFLRIILKFAKAVVAQAFILPRLPCLEEVLKTRCKKCITTSAIFYSLVKNLVRKGILPLNNYLLKRVLIVVLGFVHAIKNLLTYSLSFESSS